jgi:fermentation-respiration switch protein FrsA (DUF1100 family)
MAAPGSIRPRKTSRIGKYAARTLGALLVIYVAACALFYFEQDNLTFPVPTHYPAATPLDAGMPFEDLHLPVDGSQQIHAWWIPAAAATKKVLIAFHGNGVVIEHGFGPYRSLFEYVPLHNLGVNLLVVEYRGYGSSSAVPPSEQRMNEDAQAAFAYLTTRRRVPGRDVVILGRSIGTGPATVLAAQHPEAGGLILMSPFTSLSDAGRAIWFLRPLPLSLLVRNPFDNLSKINTVHIPVFITVGADDELTPPEKAQALFSRANQPKHFYLVPTAGHMTLTKVGGQALESQLRAFIESLN